MGWLENPGRRRRLSREAAETPGFWSRSRKGTFQRDHKRWLGSRSPAGCKGACPKATVSSTAMQHGLEAFTRSSGTWSSCAPSAAAPQNRGPTAKAWEGKSTRGVEGKRGRSWLQGTRLQRGSCTVPGGVQHCLLAGEWTLPADPSKTAPTSTLFFLTSCCSKGRLEASTAQTLAESTLQWALGGQWEPYACCSLDVGHRRDPGTWQRGRDTGRGLLGAAGAEQLHPRAACCTHRVLLQSDAALEERKLDSPLWLWAPAERCPWDRGLGVVRSSSAKNGSLAVGC